MSTFWGGLSGKLADQWINAILTPGFVFWLGGFIIWVIHVGLAPLKLLEMQLNQFSLIGQLALLIAVLLVIVISSNAIQLLDLTILRELEGYWPRWLNWLRNWCAHRKKTGMRKKQERFDQLITQEEAAEAEHKSISPEVERERVQLSLELRLTPKLSEEYMPTKLGNILRAAENRPYERYGLVTTICWPRLWLLLPEGTKQELTEARTALNTAARTFLWSFLFLVWTIWAWWVPLVTLVVAFWAYRWALSAAVVYGDLLEAAFDLHRFELYEALRFPLPKDTSEEKGKGDELTAYMFYGSVAQPVTFQKYTDTKHEQSTTSEDHTDNNNEATTS
jgi:hypothetical protein